MMRSLLLFSLALPLMTGARAQELPYAFVLSLQAAAEAARKVDGVVCQIRLEHTRVGDTRPYSITVRSPKGKTPVEVDQGGAFRLPLLPESDWGQATMMHSLEKGALTLSVSFDITRALAADPKEQKSLYAHCAEIASAFQGIDNILRTLGQIAPELADLRLAIIGLSFPRTKPANGRALIKKKDSVAATVDLSQAGPFAMLFDEFDPKEHTIVWELPKDAQPAPVELIFRSGAEAKNAKNAIPIRKIEE